MNFRFIVYFTTIAFPFIFLSPFVIKYIEVGNDFELYYFVYKKYIFELLLNGHLPYWSPGEAAGYSLIFNPLAQFFYLPSWILYFISSILGELSKYSFLIYTIFGISIFNLGLFLFLRTFNLKTATVLTTVILVSMSLKITELIRFPNAIHTFAWFPWILYGINLSLFNNNYKKIFLVTFSSTVFILTAGYPYYIFYGILLFTLYFIFLFFFKRKLEFKENKNNFSKFPKTFISLAVPAFLGLALVLPWLMKINQIMNITTGRNIADINFSYMGSSSLLDQVGSWIYPPVSQAEGWYYFGSLSTLIILVFSLNQIHSKFLKQNFKFIVYFFVFLFLINYQFSNPKDSYLFKFFWSNIEFIQNFRFWSRINIILVPIMAVLLAFSINNFILITTFKNKSNDNTNILNNLTIIFLIIIFFQIFLINNSNIFNNYWNTWQLKRILYVENSLPFILSNFVAGYKNYIYLVFFIISFIYIFVFIKIKFLQKIKPVYIYLSIICISFFELFFLANIQWAIPFNYYDDGFEKLNLKTNYNQHNKNALEDLKKSFLLERVSIEKSGSNTFEGNTYYRNNKKFNINHINNWGNSGHSKIFQKYFVKNGNFIRDIDDQTKKYVLHFFGMDNSKKKIFITSKISHENIVNFVIDTESVIKQNQFDMKLNKYNGDEIHINLVSKDDGWLSFIDTWDPNWVAYNNDTEVEIEQLFNAYKAIKIQKGVNDIKFIYKPFNLNFK